MNLFSRNKRLILNMITSIVAYAVSLGVSFILSPFLVKTLGKETYSFYSISHSFAVYMSVLTTSLNSISTRFVALEIAKKEYKKANDCFKSVFATNLIICAVLFIPMVVIVVCLEHFLNIPADALLDVKALFAFTFAAMIIQTLTSMLGIATIATDRLDLRSYRTIGGGILKLALYIILYSVFKPRIFMMGAVIVAESLYTLCVQVVFTKKLLPQIKLSEGSFSKTYTKTLLSSSVWNALNYLGNQLFLGTTVVLANILLGVSASGNISVTNTLTGFVGGGITAIVGVFVPRLIKKHATGDTWETVKEIVFSQKVLAVFSNTIVIGIIIMGKDFFKLWMPTLDSDILYKIAILLIIPLFASGNSWTIYNMSTILNKVKIPAIAMITLGVCNVVFCVLGAKWFGAQQLHLCMITAILSSTYNIVVVPCYIAHCMKVKFRYFYATPMKSLIITVLCVVLGKYFYSFIDISGWISFFGCAIVVGVLALVVNAAGLFADRICGILTLKKRGM